MRRASYLILHGIENHRPPDHWQFWLAAQLAVDGHQVLYPDLPDADEPRFEAWAHHLRALLDELHGDERVVICHSLSCLLWMRESAAMPLERRPDRLLLVAPPDSTLVPETGASFRLASVDADAVRDSVRATIRIAVSDNDPYNRLGAQALYGESLGVQVDVVASAGHITPSDGYGPWPSVAAWAADPSRRLVAR